MITQGSLLGLRYRYCVHLVQWKGLIMFLLLVSTYMYLRQ